MPSENQSPQAKLVAGLERLQQVATSLGLKSRAAEQTGSMLARIERNSLSLAVVGDVQSGKSMLLNALLGQGLLPTASTPCTATLTRITSGHLPVAKLVFKSNEPDETNEKRIDLNRLAPHITGLTPAFAATAQTIREAVVYHPKILDHNQITFFDTPGLNNQPAGPEQIIQSILPQADVVIMVMAPNQPISAAHADLLKQLILLTNIGQIIGVLTGIDRLPAAAGQQTVAEMARQLRATFDQQLIQLTGRESDEYNLNRQKLALPLFALSSTQALQGQLTGDDALTRASGFSQFEAHLKQLLAGDARSHLTRRILASQTMTLGHEILAQLSIRAAQQQQRKQAVAAMTQTMAPLFAGLQQIAQAEISRLDVVTEQTRHQTEILFDSLETRLTQSVTQAIATAPITTADLNRTRLNIAVARLSRRISGQVEREGQALVERIQREIQQALLAAINTLYDFTVAVEQMKQHLATQWPSAASKEPEQGPAAVSAPARMAALWSEYRTIVARNSAADTEAAPTTAMGAGILAGAIDLPLISSALRTIEAETVLTKVEPTAGQPEQIEPFLAAYRQLATATLEQGLKTGQAQARREIEHYLRYSFATLKQEIDTTVLDARRQLEERYGLASNHTGAGQQLTETRATVEAICARAYRLSTPTEEL